MEDILGTKPIEFIRSIKTYYGQAKGLKEGGCEDRIIPKFFLSGEGFSHGNSVLATGVLDGHGGSTCCDYILQQLPVSMKGEFESAFSIEPVNANSLQSVLKRAFCNADTNYLYLARRNNDNSGSTAALCTFYIPPDGKGALRVLMGGLGDSRAILYRFDAAQRRIIPVAANPVHRPAIASEKRRIEGLGAQVLNIQGTDRVVQRVNQGMIGLAVSRAFGDLLMKEPRAVVSAVPEFADVEIDPELDQFIVIGTDGVFDFVNADLIGKVIARAPRNEAGMKTAISQLISLARSNGSGDDRTCVVVDFPWANRHIENTNILPHSSS
jgi:serine/threonine protein phosphatase PrpC